MGWRTRLAPSALVLFPLSPTFHLVLSILVGTQHVWPPLRIFSDYTLVRGLPTAPQVCPSLALGPLGRFGIAEACLTCSSPQNTECMAHDLSWQWWML